MQAHSIHTHHMSNSYSISCNKSGNSPDTWIEVLSSDNEDSILIQRFLDSATTAALKDNTLQPYTTEMSEAAHKLIEGVQLED